MICISLSILRDERCDSRAIACLERLISSCHLYLIKETDLVRQIWNMEQGVDQAAFTYKLSAF